MDSPVPREGVDWPVLSMGQSPWERELLALDDTCPTPTPPGLHEVHPVLQALTVGHTVRGSSVFDVPDSQWVCGIHMCDCVYQRLVLFHCCVVLHTHPGYTTCCSSILPWIDIRALS